jgi:hypothetical protein
VRFRTKSRKLLFFLTGISSSVGAFGGGGNSAGGSGSPSLRVLLLAADDTRTGDASMTATPESIDLEVVVLSAELSSEF